MIRLLPRTQDCECDKCVAWYAWCGKLPPFHRKVRTSMLRLLLRNIWYRFNEWRKADSPQYISVERFKR